MKAGVPEQLTRGLRRPDPSLKEGDDGWFHPFFVPAKEEVEETIAWREEVLRLSQTRATLTQPEVDLAFAIRRIEAYKAEYDRISEVLRTRTKALARQREVDRARLPMIKLQLEEALRDAGELDEAAKYALNADRRRKLAAAKKAVDLPDDADCGCPDDVFVDPETKEEVVFPHLQIVKRVFSKKHLKRALSRKRRGLVEEQDASFPYLLKCTKCGFTNVTPLLPEPLQRELRLRGKVSPEALVRDARLRTHDREVMRRAR